jgi:eukaryotic-like serine/threonine-protein kinase
MSRLSWLGRMGFTIVGFLLLAALSGWITLIVMTRGGEVLVPDIVGRDIVSGIEVLQEKRLYIVIQGEDFHPDAPKGVIIEQSPAPGEVKKKFATVRVILSAGPERLLMPDLRGMGIRQARIEMSRLGINDIAELQIQNNLIRQGQIIAHAPGPEELLLQGAPVKFLVSLGPVKTQFRMPDLIGLDVSQYEHLLDKIFSVKIQYSDENKFAPGTILDQIPKPGEPIAEHAMVSLIVTGHGDDESGGISLFTYRVPQGIVTKELKVLFEDATGQRILRQQIVQPSEEIKLFVPKTGTGKIVVMLDDIPVKSQAW